MIFVQGIAEWTTVHGTFDDAEFVDNTAEQGDALMLETIELSASVSSDWSSARET